MARKSSYDPTVANRIKIGTPRLSKRKRGNAPARTSRRGNGKKIR
jgi:hypothetical protein